MTPLPELGRFGLWSGALGVVPAAAARAALPEIEELGYGAGYVYAPHTEEGVGGLDCLPDSLQGTRFYEPKGEGHEAKLKARLEGFRALRGEVKKKRPT